MSSRIEALNKDFDSLKNMLLELGWLYKPMLSSEDRSALIEWMSEQAVDYDMIVGNLGDALKNIYRVGCRGFEEYFDFELLEVYVCQVHFVSDSDFEEFGQLLRCEKVVKDKIAEVVLLQK